VDEARHRTDRPVKAVISHHPMLGMGVRSIDGVPTYIRQEFPLEVELPADFARPVSVSLHKCSTGAVIFEKVQP
jgi:hypothetical protein